VRRLPDAPRFPLLAGPSPLERWERLGAAIASGPGGLEGPAELWAKREDLLPLAFGGNKLRNLQFLLGAAMAEDADTLVTSGRRWSNHCRLTAAAGARAGLAVHLVISGPPVDPPNPGVVLSRMLGATVHQAATAERAEREALVDRVVSDLRAAGRRPYVIGVGGSGVVGALGQVLAGYELLDQAAAAGFRPDVVVLPTATGGTQAGLVAAFATAGAAIRVVGMAVARPAWELRPTVEELVGELGSDGAPVEIDDRALGAGYGIPSDAAAEAAGLLARTEGVLVDPIYTAKALGGLVEMARSGELRGRRVVFWHAGGLPGLFEPLEEA
jgi:1-aminocyclopropane-1-carboxylate deaminase/D-cysteine desulfhydrase-like pyridoxal-dependent ACC family enzyme